MTQRKNGHKRLILRSGTKRALKALVGINIFPPLVCKDDGLLASDLISKI